MYTEHMETKVITFGEYATLSATQQWMTCTQLASQTKFDRLMVSYYVAMLLDNELITAHDGDQGTYYQLTDIGWNCLEEYERHNPALAMKRSTR
jgi:predicted transcriptional regulator